MRRRLGVATGARMYVRAIDPASNRITLSPAREPRPSLVELSDTHWFAQPETGRFYGRAYVTRAVWARRRPSGRGRALYPACVAGLRYPGPGQSAVLYDGEK